MQCTLLEYIIWSYFANILMASESINRFHQKWNVESVPGIVVNIKNGRSLLDCSQRYLFHIAMGLDMLQQGWIAPINMIYNKMDCFNRT